MAFDFDSLTLGEVAVIEDLSGQSIATIADTVSPKGKALAAVAMVARRRAGEPAFTFNQAMALTLDQANDLIGLNDEEPAEDSDEGKGERSEPSATV
ncbi:hypothetical protein [Agromyces archimandritae]|uniref:Tail assembly chaperone n=1 Tax=Agromyces archimandritae TaxID=2781962 RepID=A0A975FN77_9MICO|nr:hypothetical protein [Agromyces archimandritae]QTX04111.1 hypothetical protein G127AT_12530 [Agromyces archimandritae]